MESGFFSDSGLTAQIVSITSQQMEDGGSSTGYPSPADVRVFLGIPNASKKIMALSNPGVDPIQVSLVSNVPGWTASTAIAEGDIVQPSTPTGYKMRAKTAGTTSATTEPVWPTAIGAEVIDNDFTWEVIDEIHQVSEIRLATSQANLDTAVAGDPLSLGIEIAGGAGVAVWMRLVQGVHPAGDPYADIRLETNELSEPTI